MGTRWKKPEPTSIPQSKDKIGSKLNFGFKPEPSTNKESPAKGGFNFSKFSDPLADKRHEIIKDNDSGKQA